jgi:hypothetical protein
MTVTNTLAHYDEELVTKVKVLYNRKQCFKTFTILTYKWAW